MSFRDRLDRLPAWAWLAVAVLAAGATFRLGLGLEGSAPASGVLGAAPSHSEAQGSLRGYRVRLADGSFTTLTTPGEPAVVMVSSVSCGVCAEAMDDFGEQAKGAPLPRLRVVTLEGARAGAPMLARHGIAGVWHAGPADGDGQTLLTFQFPGTPTFLLVDADGAVRAAMPGYPGRQRFAPWWRVMTGERESL